MEIFGDFLRFLESVRVFLHASKEFQRFSESFEEFWRYLKSLRVFLKSFREFRIDFGDFLGIYESWEIFGDYKRVLVIFGDFERILKKKKLILQVSTVSLCSEL